MPKGMPGDYPPKKNVVKDFAELADALSVRKEEEESGGKTERKRRRRTRRNKPSHAKAPESAPREEADPSIDRLMDGMSSYMKEEVADQHAARLEATKERLFSQRSEQDNQRVAEIRTRLSELEGMATRKDVESEAVALEDELRSLEAKRTGGAIRNPDAAPASFDTPKEGREALKAAVMDVISLPDQSSAGASYDGEPNYPVPAVVPSGALVELSKREASKSVEVLAAEEALGALETKLREQTTKFYSKENRLFRRGWDDLKKTERAYDRAVYELALARKSGEGLNGLELVRDVMKKGELAKHEARKQALAVDQRYALEKALGLIPKGNAWLEARLGKNGARTLKALATAAVVTGITATAGTVGIGLLLTGGAIKFAQSLGIASVSAAGVVATGNWFDKVFGKKGQDKAKEQLETVSAEEHFTKESFERTRERIAKLIAESDDQTRERKRLMAQAVAAFGIGGAGAGMSALISLLDLNLPFTDASVGEKATGAAASMPTHDPVAAPMDAADAPLAKVPPAPEAAPAPLPKVDVTPEVTVQETPAPPAPAPSPTIAPSEAAPNPASAAEAQALGSEPVPAGGSAEAITRELNRQALDGRPAVPVSQDALDSSTPYLAAQEVSEPPVAAPVPEVVPVEPVPVVQSSAETVPVVEVGSQPEPAYEAPAAEVQEVVPQQPEPVSVQPESAPAAPVQDVQPSAPEPVAESAPERPATPPAEAAPAANINAHGVNLAEPGVAVADGKYFAHGGGSNEANYALATRFAREIAQTNPGTPVYYIEERMTVLGGLERTVRAISYDPSVDNMPMPHVSRDGILFPVPSIPNPDDYQPLPTQR